MSDDDSLPDSNADDADESDDELADRVKSGSEGIGKGIGTVLKTPPKLIWFATEGVLLGITRVIPKGSGFWQKWLKIGYGNLKRASGADRINHVMKQGQILHKPIYWNSERKRWETKGGHEWWNGGQQHLYQGPGGTPCSWAAGRATELGNQVQAEVAEALDIGAGREVYRDAKVQIDNVTPAADISANGAGGDDPSAIADGGVAAGNSITSYVTTRNPGILEDYVIDLNQLFQDDSYDDLAAGRLVSMESYYETYPETTDSEEMQHQEDRGILAQMSDDNDWRKALYFLIVACAFILLVLFGPKLLGMTGSVAGGAGAAGGGGGGIPLI